MSIVHRWLSGASVPLTISALALAFTLSFIDTAGATTCSNPIQFAPATTISTGSNPHFTAVADFNGDGKLDLAIANSYVYSYDGDGSSISILLGHGDGTFSSPVDYLAGNGPFGIVLADFNSDGITDLAVANILGDNVSILLGNGTGGVGDGTFAPRVNYPAGPGPWAIVAADFNGDGIEDLAVSNNHGHALSLLAGNGSGGVGDGTFGPPVSFPLMTFPTGLVSGDFNGDGILDLITTQNYAGQIAVLLGLGSGGVGNGLFASAVYYPAGPEPTNLVATDLNGDGIEDLALSISSGGGVGVLLGQGSGGIGNGTFGPVTTFGPGDCGAIAAADFNLDGIKDLAVCYISGYGPTPVTLYLGNGSGGIGDGTFGNPTSYPVGQDPLNLGIGDFNGDGKLDAIVSNYYDNFVSVLRGACSADSRAPQLTSVRDVPRDEGGKVLLTWLRSSLDVTGGSVTSYRVWRRIPAALALAHTPSALASVRTAHQTIVARHEGDMVVYWEALATLPAQRLEGYGYTAATLQDSMRASNPYTAFFVTALTNNIDVFYDSAVDSGYSVDNLPPRRPRAIEAAYDPAGVALQWPPNSETDLSGYRLHRGPNADFVPSDDNLIAVPPDAGYYDHTGTQSHSYKLAAVDIHGNLSPFAALSGSGTTGVEPNSDVAFALRGMRPNPAMRGALNVAFTLPDAEPAVLEMFDLSGRLVASRSVGGLGAGRHTLNLDDQAKIRSGLYLLRLSRAGVSLTGRAVVVR